MPEYQHSKALNSGKHLSASKDSTVKRGTDGAKDSSLAVVHKAGINPATLSKEDVLQLQRTIGNRAVTQLFAAAGVVGDSEIVQKKENRTGLPDNLKAGVESLSGMDLDDVRVHYNSPKPAGLQALAYTKGTDIHVGPGQESHLPHEAWHVAQQKQGRVRPTIQAEGIPINDDEGLEREASEMGDKAIQLASMPLQRKTAGTQSGGVSAPVIQTYRVNDDNLGGNKTSWGRTMLQDNGKRHISINNDNTDDPKRWTMLHVTWEEFDSFQFTNGTNALHVYMDGKNATGATFKPDGKHSQANETHQNQNAMDKIGETVTDEKELGKLKQTIHKRSMKVAREWLESIKTSHPWTD